MKIGSISRRAAVAVTAAATVATLASASALGGSSSGGLGAGGAVVDSCDPNGFTVTHVMTGSTVTDLTVEGIHDACSGGELSVTIADSVGAPVGSGGPATVPGGGGSVTISLSPQPDISVIGTHAIHIVGP